MHVKIKNKIIDMTNEEKFIRQRMGGDSPFKVPEGYFDRFATELMDKLPVEEATPMPAQPSAIVRHLRPLLYAAASVVVVFMSAAIYFNGSDNHSTERSVAVASMGEVSDDAYIDEAADYAMVDNYDIYACLMND